MHLHLLLLACVVLVPESGRFVRAAIVVNPFRPLPTSARLASTMQQVDATGWDLQRAPSTCGGEPSFPVGKQTLVRVKDGSGTERTFIIYVPNSYLQRNGSKVALKVLFHGLNDDCGNFLDGTGFTEHVDRDGYIIASACGSLGILGVGWNAGTCCGFSSPDSPDDFAFTKLLVDTVAAGACVDREKVIAVGFSNGAMMAEVLACRLPHVVRAVVSVGGVVELRPGNAEGLMECAREILENPSGCRSSVLMVHGKLDNIVPINGYDFLTSTTPTVAQGGCRNSIIEIVYALNQGHVWPSDDEFSTTEYAYEFGKRVFGRY
uniref:AB hydrolase-1 domain-containing protein n=1 Tax=Trypanosoma vivax (strain Y486) TaxID=1055687 RepID=G0U7T5_TRYVY|nr:conserved hypothetical protein, fragment [Trypanosoma vivax Y486]